MITWRRNWRRQIGTWTFNEGWPGIIKSSINLPSGSWRLLKKNSRRLKGRPRHKSWGKTPQDSKFWPLLHNMLLKTLEGHACQVWAKFDKFWFFVIFGFLAKTHGHRHFSLGHPQRMKMVSLDAIILVSHTQWFLDQLKIIFSPKIAKNTCFFYTLPRLSAKPIFWFFTHRSVFGWLLVVIWEKTKHFQKLDTQSFPTSHHEPHFDIGKASKSCQKVRGPFADVFFEYFCKN